VDAYTPRRRTPAPSGCIEPHALLLNVPPDGQLLYKMMKVEDLLRSIEGHYLHFNCVCDYRDFYNADSHDGEQLRADRTGNAAAEFEINPKFSAANYYDQSRARTYACCFSLDNSNYIWDCYANGSNLGKVCVVFEFGKLRARLNQTLTPENSALIYNGLRCHQIFSVNYGILEYIQWDNLQANSECLPNPIKSIYLKDNKYSDEKELRVSLSALGIGQFALSDASIMDFPSSLSVAFDFRAAIAEGAIPKILCSRECAVGFLHGRLHKLRIVPSEGSGPLFAEDHLRHSRA
jgi:hypothetical protein